MSKFIKIISGILLSAHLFTAHAAIEGQAGIQVPVKTAEAAKTEQMAITEFLADKDAGQVSAAAMVGVAESIVTNIQTSQDVILALKPSDGKSKAGFGISITPARTALNLMSAKTYYNGNPITRMLGSLTFSYATKDAEVGTLAITKRALSVDTSVYLNSAADPIIIGFNALRDCTSADGPYSAMIDAANRGDRVAFDANTKLFSAALATCLAESKKLVPWNAARISVAFGTGQVSGDGFNTRGMGNAMIINAMIPLGPQASLQPVYRMTRNEIDLKTLQSQVKTENSNLAAARITYGLSDTGKVQLLAEASNLKKNTLAQSDSLFRNAVGLDLSVAKGIWLQLRYGNSRKSDGASFERKGLLSLNISPSCALSEQCGK